MSGILDLITSRMDGDALRQIGQQIGASEEATQSALQMALPVILGQLNRNAQDQGRGEGLERALASHDGSVLDNLKGFLAQSPSDSDDRMVGHIFGDRRQAVQKQLGRAAGLDEGAVGKLLANLGPLVMGALGKKKREASTPDLGGLGGLKDLLTQERHQVESRGKPGLIDSLLDADGDGDVDASDLLKRGGGLLGGLFGR